LSLRHAQVPAEPISAQMVDYEFVVLGEDEKPMLIIDKVRKYSEYNDEFKSSDIMAANLGTRAPVQAALNQLIKEGLLERVKTGWYRKIGG